MHDLQVFENETFGKIRTMLRDGAPWFFAVDACRALDIDPTATRRLDDDEKVTLRLTQGESNRTSETTLINEPGLYTLVLGSRKPEARAFKRWITHEIIPAIRQTGMYAIDKTTLSSSVPTVPTSRAPRAKPVDIVFRQRLNMARDFSRVTGVPLGISVAKAIDDAEKLTGEDYDHWKRALPARTDETPVPHLNATQLGAMSGLSAKEMNIQLEAAGLQTKVDKSWRLTEAGKLHAEEYPFDRNGHSDYCIRWHESAAEAVKCVANQSCGE